MEELHFFLHETQIKFQAVTQLKVTNLYIFIGNNNIGFDLIITSAKSDFIFGEKSRLASSVNFTSWVLGRGEDLKFDNLRPQAPQIAKIKTHLGSLFGTSQFVDLLFAL